MEFIKIPNIPERPVTLAIIDGRIGIDLEIKFKELGIEVVKTTRHEVLYEAIALHPDIVFHHIGENKIVYAPGVDQGVLKILRLHGFQLIAGNTALGCKYPANIAYNVARVGNFAFHNLKYTDPVLKEELIRRGIEFVHVKQGYAKCSVSVINGFSIITADRGICSAAEKKGIEVLIISPEDNIQLPGLDMGFIGGCSGLIDKNVWAIAGDFQTLKSAGKISKFLNDKGIKICSLSTNPIVDIGSIIPLKQV